MAWAEFEEKEYETAALGELMRRDASGLGFAFSAGQVLEKIVGYDAAASPSPAHVVWRILEMPRPPGVRLLPSFWASGIEPDLEKLPATSVTLVLQFKRPEYLFGTSASQWRFWGQPYFRFSREVEQQRVLYALERGIGEGALVRYAAPALWKRGDLEAAHLRGRVIDESGYVAPSRIARHRCWTYLRPGIDGRANAGGTPGVFESREELLGLLTQTSDRSTDLVPSEGLGERVEKVGQVASSIMRPALRRAVQRWTREVGRRERALKHQTVQRIGAVAMLTTLTSSVGATWLQVDGT